MIRQLIISGRRLRVNFVSYKELHEDIIEWTKTLPDFNLIVGIPRSGLLPALLLSLHYNIPLSEIESFENDHIFKSGQRGQSNANLLSTSTEKKEKIKVLIVDDSCTSGNTINTIKESLKNFKYLKNYGTEYITSIESIKYGAMYVTEDSKKYVDYFCRIIDHPRCFQWNWMHHLILTESCCDIDGVLCEPPNSIQNDDSENYIQFLKKTKPIFIPTVKIKNLVTCRLEKYRNLTEEWLFKYNIKYDKLFMMNYSSMQERQRVNQYAEYKADIYLKSNTILFIEDEIIQAQKIAQITKKPVLCTGNWNIYNGKNVIFYYRKDKHVAI